ncbi:glycosyltransferase family 2 protein [Scytonema sp. NUACC26]|uniref:glycosyltransferase family 2 protein n=1 Tax=Scytonema sp. NUACC26 TaxID=3140176 RepID=UPI0034DC5011
MFAKPKVSIITPTYNTSRYVEKALESALAQVEQNIEVIVVDDASTDNTVEVVNSFCDPRIKLLVNESHQGPSYSRNRALKEAKGEWIALLDSDDWYAPKRLEKLLQVAEKENADLVADDLYVITEGENTPWSITIFKKNRIKLDQPKQIDLIYFIERHLSVTKPLIKLSFLVKHNLKFNESLKYEEDFVLFFFCLLKGSRFIILPEPYYFYQIRAGSLMKEYVEFYEQACQTNLSLLQQECTKKNPQLKRALLKRLNFMKQTRAFYRVRQAFKEGGFFTGLTEVILNPNFLPVLWEKLPGIFRYYFLHRLNTN